MTDINRENLRKYAINSIERLPRCALVGHGDARSRASAYVQNCPPAGSMSAHHKFQSFLYENRRHGADLLPDGQIRRRISRRRMWRGCRPVVFSDADGGIAAGDDGGLMAISPDRFLLDFVRNRSPILG